ncbi:glutathione S-transferase 3-like [Panicum miliaceum]|uniref:Glutathione S-transferase 3-like n=1 Tax=Panicum miliaceum TaxID=4540 RepID=A0A3L6TFR9_PANMI|nr:glutathione S-transferase 3-like [Panicum miliaceum]
MMGPWDDHELAALKARIEAFEEHSANARRRDLGRRRWRWGTPLAPPRPAPEGPRFWADFVDQKVFSTQTRFLKSKGGEDKATAKEELLDQLKRLEEVLGDKTFFAGDEFGFLDAVLIPFSSMFRGYEQHGGFSLETECPNLMRWVRRCKERESVRSVLPDDEEMYELHKKWYGIE